ncbi:copper chaperone PCu(A)C [Sphingomonas aracearum]|uniref:Copper chaperone PCu(A)C n=2 Tax=Sphingomonas aracearum TaxID=2283317 RepID=A0A369VWA8_9SPHN|nr:copper chaperone PCu(A)C [Sphingomonas aracearum]
MIAAVAGCAEAPRQLEVTGGYVRLSAVPRNPAAAYFTIQNGPSATRLITVTSEAVIRSEMHESRTNAGGMSSMKPLQDVPVSANGTLEFKPGGRHVMLFNVNPGVKPGYRMLFSFTFANGQRLQRRLPVIGAGDPAPGTE